MVKKSTEASAGSGLSGDDILRYVLQGSLSEFAFVKPERVYAFFEADIDDSTFVLFSVGPDGANNAARVVGEDGKDILYWPSILSLMRQHQIDAERGLTE
jgi:hypothetical protein